MGRAWNRPRTAGQAGALQHEECNQKVSLQGRQAPTPPPPRRKGKQEWMGALDAVNLCEQLRLVSKGGNRQVNLTNRQECSLQRVDPGLPVSTKHESQRLSFVLFGVAWCLLSGIGSSPT